MRLTTTKPNGHPTGKFSPVYDEYGGAVDAVPTYHTRFARKLEKLDAPRREWRMNYRNERLAQNGKRPPFGQPVRRRKEAKDPLAFDAMAFARLFKEMGFGFLPNKRTELRVVGLP